MREKDIIIRINEFIELIFFPRKKHETNYLKQSIFICLEGAFTFVEEKKTLKHLKFGMS